MIRQVDPSQPLDSAVSAPVGTRQVSRQVVEEVESGFRSLQAETDRPTRLLVGSYRGMGNRRVVVGAGKLAISSRIAGVRGRAFVFGSPPALLRHVRAYTRARFSIGRPELMGTTTRVRMTLMLADKYAHARMSLAGCSRVLSVPKGGHD